MEYTYNSIMGTKIAFLKSPFNSNYLNIAAKSTSPLLLTRAAVHVIQNHIAIMKSPFLQEWKTTAAVKVIKMLHICVFSK